MDSPAILATRRCVDIPRAPPLELDSWRLRSNAHNEFASVAIPRGTGRTARAMRGRGGAAAPAAAGHIYRVRHRDRVRAAARGRRHTACGIYRGDLRHAFSFKSPIHREHT
eukprot:COSAG02_NODE_10084_length_2030_cov_2.026929_3_plen_110_part_01